MHLRQYTFALQKKSRRSDFAARCHPSGDRAALLEFVLGAARRARLRTGLNAVLAWWADPPFSLVPPVGRAAPPWRLRSKSLSDLRSDGSLAAFS